MNFESVNATAFHFSHYLKKTASETRVVLLSSTWGTVVVALYRSWSLTVLAVPTSVKLVCLPLCPSGALHCGKVRRSLLTNALVSFQAVKLISGRAVVMR